MVLLSRKPVDLTYKEFELLKTFASTPGRVYTREELLRNIWGYDYFGGTRTVDVHVRRVRSKIEHNRSYIETVHGVGYRFAAEPE
jgi:DNA-binding response OmpR family regulator